MLQKQTNKCIQFRDLVTPYAELENRLKALEEKIKKNKYVYTNKNTLILYICTIIISHINLCLQNIND